MKTWSVLTLAALVTCLAVSTPVAIAGEAKPIGTVAISGNVYNNQKIDIFSFQWDEKNDVILSTGGGGGGSKVVFSGFTVLKAIDAFSPQIFHDVAVGKFFPQVRIELGAKKGVTASYLLETVALVGDGVAKQGDNATPLEVVTFKVFDRITVTTTDASGATTT